MSQTTATPRFHPSRAPREVRASDEYDANGRKIMISISYDKGGMSYLADEHVERGFWVYVQPVTLEPGMTYGTVSMGHGPEKSGVRFLAEAAPRYSDKTFHRLIARVEAHVDETIRLARTESIRAATRYLRSSLAADRIPE